MNEIYLIIGRFGAERFVITLKINNAFAVNDFSYYEIASI